MKGDTEHTEWRQVFRRARMAKVASDSTINPHASCGPSHSELHNLDELPTTEEISAAVITAVYGNIETMWSLSQSLTLEARRFPRLR